MRLQFVQNIIDNIRGKQVEKINEEELFEVEYDYSVNIANKMDARAIVCGFIENNSTVLDLVCGNGDLGVALKSNKNCTVYGMEYSEASAENAIAKSVYNDVHKVDLNLMDTDEFPKYIGMFDYIVLSDVLEHLYWPEDVLNKFKIYLKSTGRFVISLPNIAHASIKLNLLLNNFEYLDYGVLDRTHIRFFTHKSIIKLYENVNLKIEMFDITLLPEHGSHKDIFKEIPKTQREFILNDPHSFVLQYVCMLSCGNASGNNKMDIAEADNYPKLVEMQRQSMKRRN